MPKAITDDGHGPGAGLIFLGGEGAPKNGAGSKNLKPLHAHLFGGEMFDGSVMDDVEAGIAGERGGLDLILESSRVHEIGHRDEGDIEGELRIPNLHDGDPLRVVDSRRMAKDSVDHAEDSGVGPDTQHQGENRSQHESGHAAELTKRLAQVMKGHGRRAPWLVSTDLGGRFVPGPSSFSAV